MGQDKLRVEVKIEAALRSGATHLNLSSALVPFDTDKLVEILESLGRLTQLQSLDLYDNQLISLPDSVGQLTQLRSLNLSGNQLATLPESLGRLTHLQSLNLNNNRLTELPGSLSQLTQLKSLRISGNQLTMLLESLGQLKQLDLLDLSDNQLVSLPETLGQLKELKWLHLSGNRLTKVQKSFDQLRQLEFLDLSDNLVNSLPETIGHLTQLQWLRLSGNKLTNLPNSVGRLTRLNSMDLTDNQLVRLPETLGRLTQLQSLHISQNRLTELPESIGELVRLNLLDLSSNELVALPNSLGLLAQLQTLRLSKNLLTTLPESVGQLTELQLLDVSDNRLKVLPDETRHLMQLRELTLDGNLLQLLPQRIGELPSLKVLSLGSIFNKRGNPLFDLPTEIRSLENLEQLDVSFCPHLKLPSEIVAEKWRPKKILDYYFSTRNDKGTALRELKLIVVGRGGVGKTSLIKRLNGIPLDKDENETHGINISSLKLNCHDGLVTSRVWDFGGQHVLHAMHEFFLTARSLYLLVLGEREDMAERDAAYWLQLIRSYAGKAPVVVVLNKNEGRAREMDRESLERQYGPILAWVSTECSDGFDETIENLRSALTKAADTMPEIRALFPKKWWSVKEWLENMEESYLDFATYKQKCRELGEQDEEQQEQLAAWLNDLGIAINYANDERLHDTTVLRPEWLANGIYAILRANDSHHKFIHAPDAILTVERLGSIYSGAEMLKMLRAEDYPSEKWPFLLQLMNLFQLAFPVDDSGKILLVPTLLPLEPPSDCDEPEDEDRTRLRYEFAVVPGPLLPKLLVRTFSLIDGKRRWRRGAILRYGEALARVWTTQDERWVQITGVGNQKDRNELLTMIRITLHELFSEYRDLRVVEQWEYKEKWVPRETLEDFGVLDRYEIQEEVQ